MTKHSHAQMWLELSAYALGWTGFGVFLGRGQWLDAGLMLLGGVFVGLYRVQKIKRMLSEHKH